MDLGPSIPIPALMLLGVGGILLLIIIILIIVIVSVYTNGKEGFIFAKARKKNLNVLSVVDVGSNHAKFVLGTKKKPDDIEYDNKISGVQVDPSLTTGGAVPTRYEKGLNIYNFSTIDWLPITNSNALAYQTIRKWKDDHPNYNVFTFLEFVSLISTPKNQLIHDLKNYISKYNPTYTFEKDGGVYEQEYNVEELSNIIQYAREEITKLPIVPGFFCFNQAFEAIPMAYSAQDLEQLKILIRKQIEQEWMRKINVMIYAIAGVLIMVGGGVAVYIVKTAAGA